MLERGRWPACFSLAALAAAFCERTKLWQTYVHTYNLTLFSTSLGFWPARRSFVASAAAVDVAVLLVGGGAGDWLQPATLVQAMNAWLRTFYYLQRLCGDDDSGTIGQCCEGVTGRGSQPHYLLYGSVVGMLLGHRVKCPISRSAQF